MVAVIRHPPDERSGRHASQRRQAGPHRGGEPGRLIEAGGGAPPDEHGQRAAHRRRRCRCQRGGEPDQPFGVPAGDRRREQVPRGARGGLQQRGHGRAEPSVRALEAEQVEPGEHATDDVVAGRGGAHAGTDGRRDARAEPAAMRLDGAAGELRRALAGDEAGGVGRAVRQSAIELGELRRGDAVAGRSRDAQLDGGRGGVPRAQVDRRRRAAVGERGPAGEDRGEGGPIGHAEPTRHQAVGARGHRDERAGPGGEHRCRLSEIDDGQGVDIGRPGQRPIAAQAARRLWTVGEHR